MAGATRVLRKGKHLSSLDALKPVARIGIGFAASLVGLVWLVHLLTNSSVLLHQFVDLPIAALLVGLGAGLIFTYEAE